MSTQVRQAGGCSGRQGAGQAGRGVVRQAGGWSGRQGGGQAGRGLVRQAGGRSGRQGACLGVLGGATHPGGETPSNVDLVMSSDRVLRPFSAAPAAPKLVRADHCVYAGEQSVSQRGKAEPSVVQS